MVTVYASPLKLEQTTQFTSRSTSHADGTDAVGQDPLEAPVTVSFYRALSSETIDIFVTRQQQLDRIGVTVTSVPDGAPRAAVIRRLCRFFEASLKSLHGEEDLGQEKEEDLLALKDGIPEARDDISVMSPLSKIKEGGDDLTTASGVTDTKKIRIPTDLKMVPGSGSKMMQSRSTFVKKTLVVELLGVGKDFKGDYDTMGRPLLGEVRPVGLPAAFMPLDTMGELLERRAMGLAAKPYLGNKDLVPSEERLSGLLEENEKGKEKKKLRMKRGLKGKNKEIEGGEKETNVIDYQVSIYAKSPLPGLKDDESGVEGMSNPAKGLVVKFYDQASGGQWLSSLLLSYALWLFFCYY